MLSAHNHILLKVKVNICMESCLFAQFRLCDYFEFLQELKIENEIPGWTDNSGYTRSRLTFLWTEQKNGLFAKIPSEMVFYPCSHGSWMPLSPLLLWWNAVGDHDSFMVPWIMNAIKSSATLFDEMRLEIMIHSWSHGSWIPLSPLLLCWMKCIQRSWFIHGPMDHEYH